jgi:hypothetical protein
MAHMGMGQGGQGPLYPWNVHTKLVSGLMDVKGIDP